MTEIPLNQRVSAPATLDRPAQADGVSWRAATVDDVDAILDCERAICLVDHPHYVATREEIEEEFEHSWVDAASDTIVALDETGRVLAWGISILSPGQDTLVRSILAGGVRPEVRGRGLGRQLLAWQKLRGEQQLASSEKSLPGWLMGFFEERVADAARLFERFGFTISRYFLQLDRDLSAPIDVLPEDADLRFEQYDGRRLEATRIARNNAFRDHWGSQPSTEEQWASFMGRAVSRPDLSFLAIGRGADGEEEVAGFVLVSVNEDDWPGQGFSSAYIELVGVPREWRRRGIAPALLTRTLKAVAAAGIDRAVLDVDSDSPTGALGLYTGLGFVESHRSLSVTRVY